MSFLYFMSCFTREFLTIGRIYGEDEFAVTADCFGPVLGAFPICFGKGSINRDLRDNGPALGDLWLYCACLE